MQISAPDSGLSRAEAADWFELEALIAGPVGYSLASLVGALELQEHSDGLLEDEGGVVEDEILESKYDAFSEELLRELEWRSLTLGPLYPFQIARSGPGWSLVRGRALDATSRAAHEVYLVCLLISGLRYHFIEGSDATSFWDSAPRVFQIVSHQISRGLVGGTSSFWLAWPRPERDDFAPALRRLVGELGVGKVRESAPPSQQGRTKDAGIDVVAWRSFADGRPAPIVSYGQVASGRDWRDKSVETTLESHFHHWMTERPVTHFVPAIYIPFMQHDGVAARVGADFDEVAHDASVVLEARLGVVLDRHRLTELAPSALLFAGPNDRDYLKEVVRWRAALLSALS